MGDKASHSLRSPTGSRPTAKAGRYVTFVLGHEEYGAEIVKIREIIGVVEITALPRTSDFVKGVINLRGKVILVVDLRLRFGMQEKNHTKETCIVVVNAWDTLVGLLVDTVSEVVDIAAADIEPPPELGGLVRRDYLLGIGKVKGKIKILLDVDTLLKPEEMLLPEDEASQARSDPSASAGAAQ